MAEIGEEKGSTISKQICQYAFLSKFFFCACVDANFSDERCKKRHGDWPATAEWEDNRRTSETLSVIILHLYSEEF